MAKLSSMMIEILNLGATNSWPTDEDIRTKKGGSHTIDY